ncbi:MAG: biotin transporter BioY [Oscillospiraceae bacterium]|jgi:biotin transport system substrate-specific component|nr:biotin transporter BioY [Oscillospiraceae bacterium]
MAKAKFRPLTLCLCGLFAALSAVLSWTSIPIGPVPIALTHVSIFMAAGLLGPWYGTASQLVFVLLGAAGVPVFTGFRGGLGHIAGPLGGFIFSYIATVFVTGLLIDRFGTKLPVLVPALAAGWLFTYGFGVPWIAWQLQIGIPQALTAYCLPFLPGDAAKTALCAVLLNRLYPLLRHKVRAA